MFIPKIPIFDHEKNPHFKSLYMIMYMYDPANFDLVLAKHHV